MGFLGKSVVLALSALSMMGNVDAFDQDKDWEKAKSIYEFHANDINGTNVPLKKFEGHPLIVVNVASNCGLTDKNYKQLQELYLKYGNEGKTGLKILAFPSSDFLNQEPGTSKDILEFIKKYNVTFDVFEKIHVNGDEAHPLWKWLKTQKGGTFFDAIKWNFTKFLVDKEGKPVERFGPSDEPLSMEEMIKKYL